MLSSVLIAVVWQLDSLRIYYGIECRSVNLRFGISPCIVNALRKTQTSCYNMKLLGIGLFKNGASFEFFKVMNSNKLFKQVVTTTETKPFLGISINLSTA